MRFNPEITLGTIVIVLTLIATIFTVYIAFVRRVDRYHHEAMMRIESKTGELREDVSVLKVRVGDLWEWFRSRMERRERTKLEDRERD